MSKVQLARVHVNNKPLSGPWDGQHWDPQTARCSNNFMSWAVAPPGVGSLEWVAESDDPEIVFNVSSDLKGEDERIFIGVTNNTVTGYLPDRPSGYDSRGIYIAGVQNATRDFHIVVYGAP